MEELILKKVRNEAMTKLQQEEIIQLIKDFDLKIDEEKLDLLMNKQQEKTIIKLNKNIINI